MLVFKKYSLTLLLLFLPSLLISQEDSKYLSNAEIIKIMENSKTTYKVNSINKLKDISFDSFSEIIYPQMTKHIEYPLIIETDSSISLSSFPFDCLAWEEILKGEEFYKKEDYSEALKFYDKAINISDQLYIAYLNAGDCYLMQDSAATALEYYKLAFKINPYDYRTSFYQASAYSKLHDYKNAKKNYINALALKPRHKNLINILNSMHNELKIKVNTQTFEPKSLIRREDDDIALYLDLNNDVYWMAYAFAKAIWLGEKDIRLKISNSIDNEWNSHAECQAIFSLIENYFNMLENNKIDHNEYLDQILAIMKEGYLSEFVIYEIASKMNPDVVLQMPKDFRKRIKEYVKKYVVIDLD